MSHDIDMYSVGANFPCASAGQITTHYGDLGDLNKTKRNNQLYKANF